VRACRQSCLSCYRDFSRKWNAERHNKDLDAEQAQIVSINEFLYGPIQNNSKSGKSDSDYERAKNLLIDRLEGMGKEFEECEHELQSFPVEKKDRLLGYEVWKAFTSSNPKASMRCSLGSFRSERMIGCVAKSMKVDSELVQDIFTCMVAADRYH
jgi:hypothetical protein